MTRQETQDRHDYPHSRRTVLVGVAGASTIGLAGCAGQQGEDGETTTETSTDEPSETTTSTSEVALTDPIDVPGDASCAVCEMKAAKFPEWNAEISFEDGHRAHFCSPGCMTAYYADPGQFEEGRTQDALLGAWAHDYVSREFVDARAAYWVLEMNADRIDAPMMKNPLPFEAESAATAYVDQYEDLSTDDVIQLTDFDRDLVTEYRGKFF